MSSESENSSKLTIEKKIFGDPIKDTSPLALRELLEKNLKWSQIIYEQNRRLNSRLVWSLVANWLRLCIILIPIVLGILFLPNIVRNFQNKYNTFLAPTHFTSNTSTSAFQDVLKIINTLDSTEKAELNKILK